MQTKLKYKFRGKRVDNGEYVYGDLISIWEDGQEYPRIRSTRDYYTDKNGNRVADCFYYDVLPESVAMLVYVDKTGKEYYEGDIMERDGRYWKASLVMKWIEVAKPQKQMSLELGLSA